MTPALIVQRLIRAGHAVRTIERKCGLGRSRLSRLVEGNASLSAEERATLEEFAAQVLPRGSTSSPHHERCAPRFGR